MNLNARIDLSIIIVSYNVPYFLANCLESIYSSDLIDLEIEIVIVDNNSVDNSVSLIKSLYGNKVVLIENDENIGFGNACNQGLEHSKGEYILFLNPDTLLHKDTLTRSLAYLESHSDVGALGVKMIDGRGNFLPESKRSFPTLWNSFCKFSGLSSFFSGSTIFDSYNAGNLDQNEIHSIDVLCGAFILTKKTVLEKSGAFNPRYFMYGEDIDLCKCIKESGYTVIYHGGLSIIHFKGESTDLRQWSYYNRFFGAMSIYNDRHMKGIGKFLLFPSIHLVKVFSFILNKLKGASNQFLDWILYSGLFIFLYMVWGYIKTKSYDYYPMESLFPIICVYAGVMVLSIFLLGGYSKRSRIMRYVLGIIVGSISLLVIHALIPTEYRFSRGVLLAFFPLSLVLYVTRKKIMREPLSEDWHQNIYTRIGIISPDSAYDSIVELLNDMGLNNKLIGRIEPSDRYSSSAIGNVNQLNDLTSIYKLSDIIIDTSHVDSELLAESNKSKYTTSVNFKFYSKATRSLIESHNTRRKGTLYSANFVSKLSQEEYVRQKRIVDLFISIILILVPLFILFKPRLYTFIFSVLAGRYSWISYNKVSKSELNQLPRIKQGVIELNDGNHQLSWSGHLSAADQNREYANRYSFSYDLEIFFRYLINSKN